MSLIGSPKMTPCAAVLRRSSLSEKTNFNFSEKKKILLIQAIIDEEPEPWIIMKPSGGNPADPESPCIFENPSEHTQARAEIPLAWFEGRQSEKIKEAIRHSLRHAQVMYKSQ